jgi:hypothetical protein
MARKSVFLLRETSGAKAPEESAAAVVAWTPGESPEERRAKEPKRQPRLENSVERPGSRSKPRREWPCTPLPAGGLAENGQVESCLEDEPGRQGLRRLANLRPMKALNELNPKNAKPKPKQRTDH